MFSHNNPWMDKKTGNDVGWSGFCIFNENQDLVQTRQKAWIDYLTRCPGRYYTIGVNLWWIFAVFTGGRNATVRAILPDQAGKHITGDIWKREK